MAGYELVLLGAPTVAERETLTATIKAEIDRFGLAVGTEVVIRDAATLDARDRRAAAAAAYFGTADHGDADVPAARRLIVDGVPIIPTIGATAAFETAVPGCLHPFNAVRRRADDDGMTELAIALLECVGLLRRQRRVFVSYRRADASPAAIQLHDRLSARGFDVFLDTHDIRPGAEFQDELWHRLCDCDVVLVLDTPAYNNSKWTRQEIGRAGAKGIQFVRAVWPGHGGSAIVGLGDTLYLEPDDLIAADGPIADAKVDQILLTVERVRSRSLAARHRLIRGYLHGEAELTGALTVDGVGADRAIALRLRDGRRLLAYPAVGVPSAETLYDTATKAQRWGAAAPAVVLYDHVGIGAAWAGHLEWLDQNLRAVRAVKVREAAWALAAWEA